MLLERGGMDPFAVLVGWDTQPEQYIAVLHVTCAVLTRRAATGFVR